MDNVKTLSPKEILIAYVTTLSDKKCKEGYQILQERFEINRKKSLLFNRQGVEALAPDGKIRLTPNQFNMVIETYGEQGFHRLCELLYDYITNLEERAQYEITAKRSLRNYNKISHYYKLTKGWVAQRYEEELRRDGKLSEGPRVDESEIIYFDQVDNKPKAIAFIKSIPTHLRFDNVDVNYLINMYGISNEDLS